MSKKVKETIDKKRENNFFLIRHQRSISPTYMRGFFAREDDKFFMANSALQTAHSFGKQHTALANSTQLWQTAHSFGKQHTALANSPQLWQTAHRFCDFFAKRCVPTTFRLAKIV
jgi:hypothetical protein